MNRFMKEQWSIIEGTHGLRTQVLDAVNDDELAFTPGGQNMTLGELCREIGEIEYSYIQSIKTLKQDWSYRKREAGLVNSVAALKAWFAQLDEELKKTVSALSDEQLEQNIDRGFEVPVYVQLEIYLQALLIFLGKATVYLKAMEKELPQQIAEWIG